MQKRNQIQSIQRCKKTGGNKSKAPSHLKTPPKTPSQNAISHTHTHAHKIAGSGGHTPVVPGTQEAEVGGSLESREVKAAVSCDCTTALHPKQ